MKTIMIHRVKLVLSLLLLSLVGHAQSFKVATVSLYNELTVNQQYLNSAPTGFTETIGCPDSLAFCVITGSFAENISVNAPDIYLVSKDNKKFFPVGMVDENGLPKLSTFGIDKSFERNISPIFAIAKGAVPNFLMINNEKIDVKGALANTKLEIKGMPELDIVSATFVNKVSINDYSLLPANMQFGQGPRAFTKNFAPIKGKVLCLELSVKSTGDVNNNNEFAVYSATGFQSNGIAIETYGSVSDMGSLREGDNKMYFIVATDFKVGELRYKGVVLKPITVK